MREKFRKIRSSVRENCSFPDTGKFLDWFGQFFELIRRSFSKISCFNSQIFPNQLKNFPESINLHFYVFTLIFKKMFHYLLSNLKKPHSQWSNCLWNCQQDSNNLSYQNLFV